MAVTAHSPKALSCQNGLLSSKLSFADGAAGAALAILV
jgi:hypothetical protein